MTVWAGRPYRPVRLGGRDILVISQMAEPFAESKLLRYCARLLQHVEVGPLAHLGQVDGRFRMRTLPRRSRDPGSS